MIIRGGENIACAHVEAAPLMYPEVHEAAVHGVPDERLDEEPGATIHAAADIGHDARREFLASHLARFEIPRPIVRSDAPLARMRSGEVLGCSLHKAALASMATSRQTTFTPGRLRRSGRRHPPTPWHDPLPTAAPLRASGGPARRRISRAGGAPA